TADATGHFAFSGVNLGFGANTFTVQTAEDLAGNRVQASKTSLRTNAPVVAAPQPDVNVTVCAADTVLNLSNVFSDPDQRNSVVRFNTILGPIDVQLFDDRTPLTVANFLQYIYDDAYVNSIFHRSVPGFVIQGGGFSFSANPSSLPAIPQRAAVMNEPGISNVR